MNARSLLNKIDFLKTVVAKEKPLIIIVTETWTRAETKDCEIAVPGFEVHRFDRDHSRGGGVAIYIHSSLPSWKLGCLTGGVEAVWVGVSAAKNANILIGGIYRPPNASADYDSSLAQELETACRQPNFALKYVGGDFNWPKICWRTGYYEEKHEWFMDKIHDLNLEQIIQQPTHIGGNTLDLFFTSDVATVFLEKDLPPLGLSDHFILKLIIRISQKSFTVRNSSLRFNFKKADWKKYNNLLAQSDWMFVFSGSSIDEVWSRFKQCIFDALKDSVPTFPSPVFGRKPNNLPVWYGRNLEKLYRSKVNAYRRLKKNPHSIRLRKLCSEKNKLYKKAFRKAVSNYELGLAANMGETGSKPFWSYVSSKTKCKDSNLTLKDPETGEITVDRIKCANILASHFDSVYSKPRDSYDLPTLPLPSQSDQLTTVLFDSESIHSFLKRKSDFSSPGHDQLQYIVYSKGGSILHEHLAMLFQRSLREGKLPAEWKHAHVTPIWKRKGSKLDPSNYRPISLCPSVCKIMEGVINDKIMEFMAEKNLLDDNQHGFTPGRSCGTQILDFVDFVTDALNSGDTVDCVYLDFSRAFDLLDIKCLKFKLLYSYGINGKLLDWIDDFLSSRSFQVSGISDTKFPTSGSGQGTILSPLFWNSYCLDLNSRNFLNSRRISSSYQFLKIGELQYARVQKFADDSRVFARISADPVLAREQRAQFQADLNRIEAWQNFWGLKLNVSKCAYMQFKSGRRPVIPANYTLLGTNLIEVQQFNDLGVMMSPNMDFSLHASCASAKALRMVRLLAKQFKSRNPKVLVPLFHAYVMPHLRYCCSSITPSKKQDLVKLNKPIRVFTKLFPFLKNLSFPDRLVALDLKSFEAVQKCSDMLELRKIVLGLHPRSPNSLFELAPPSTTRAANPWKIRKERAGISSRNAFLPNRAADSWNKIPESVIRGPISLFKQYVVNHCC